jgi:hypothetical protein
MKITYSENEKRHIFESETGHLSTFLKERVTKEQAEVLFQAQLANEGIVAPEVTSEEPAPQAPEAPTEELVQEDVTPTDND